MAPDTQIKMRNRDIMTTSLGKYISKFVVVKQQLAIKLHNKPQDI